MRKSQIFHHLTKEKKFTFPPSDSKDWPIEWKTIYYKSYPRLESIKLDNYVLPLRGSLKDVLIKRRSFRDFKQKPISANKLATLLKYSAGITSTDGKRAYPSGGARYPLEIYPLVLRGDDVLGPGLYHYNVLDNSLEILWKRDIISEKDGRFQGLFLYPWVWNAAVVIFITAIFERTQCKYGERGYRIILTDAGHLCQNFYLVCTALNLGGCALYGFAEEMVDEILDIDGINESTIYAFVVGPKK